MDGAIVIPVISCARAKSARIPPVPVEPPPREKPQPRFRQQHVSVEVATSLRATSPIWASPARTRERGAKPRGPAHPPSPAFASSSRVSLARLLLTIFPNGELARWLQSWSKRLGHFAFQVRKMYFKLTPLPPEQCWVLQVKHLLIYISCTLYGRQLCLGGVGGKILLRPCL